MEKKKTAAKGRKVEREQTFEIQARADSGGSLEKKKVIKRSPRVSRNVRNRDLLQAIQMPALSKPLAKAYTKKIKGAKTVSSKRLGQ